MDCAGEGRTVQAPAKVRVVEINDNNTKKSSLGTYIRMEQVDESGNIITITVGHMDSINPKITTGMYLSPSDFIGITGNTGRSTGPHAHIQIDAYNPETNTPYGRNAIKLDPRAYFEPVKDLMF